MATLSKPVQMVSCQVMLHPFTSSCTIALLDMLWASVTGSARFMALMYLVQICMRIARNSHDLKSISTSKNIRNLLLSYGKSVSFCTAMALIFLSVNCLLRNILGRFTHWTIGFLPAFCAGFAIFLETASRRPIVMGSYANMGLEALIRLMEHEGTLTWTENQKVLIFSILNAGLMYLLKHKAPKNLQHLWFFTPKKNEPENNLGKKIQEWRTSMFQYFCTGLALHGVGVVLSAPKTLLTPFTFLSMLFNSRGLKLAGFLSFYVTAYQGIEWWLEKQELTTKIDTSCIIAGLCSGMFFKLQPSTTLLNTVVITTLQVLLATGIEKGTIPNLPYWELSMSLWNGILYHMNALHTPCCPRIMVAIMAAVTSKKADYILKNLIEIEKTIGTRFK